MGPRKKPAKAGAPPTEVALTGVSSSVVDAVAPSWSMVASQWATSVGAIAAVLLLFGNIYVQYQNAKSAAIQVEQVKSQAAVAAVKVEEVKQKLEITEAKTANSLEEIKETGDAVHILVNSSMTAQLKISAVALRRIAAMTKDPDDVAASEVAERLLREHEEKQKKVDEKD